MLYPTPPGNYVLVDTPLKLNWLRRVMEDAPRFAFDIETNHVTADSDRAKEARFKETVDSIRIIGMSFSWQKGHAAYIPLERGPSERDRFWKRPSAWESVISWLRDTLTNKAGKITANGKFDTQWIYRRWNFMVRRHVFDVMLAHHLIDENRIESTHKLKDMSVRYITPDAKVYEKAKDAALDHYDPVYRRYSSVPIEILYPYACADSDYALQLADIFADRLSAEGLDDVFDGTSMTSSHVCTWAELHGLPIDEPRLEALGVMYRKNMDELIPRIREMLPPEHKDLNVGSPAQLAEFLYGTLGLPEQRSKRGGVTTDAEALKAIVDKHPIVKPVMEYRKIEKLLGTYVDGPTKRYDRTTGRLYPSILIHGSVGGRYATENPNSQNLPRGEKGGAEIKSIYRAPPGKFLTLADYSQIELRLAAHVAKEDAWRTAFLSGADLHSQTALQVFKLDCSVDDVKKLYEDKRTAAKCFHPDTEVLTRTGWKRIVDLAQGEEVAQAIPKDDWQVDLEWAVPNEVFTQYHPAKRLIHFECEGMDIRVTPDHRMVTYTAQGKPKTVLAEDMVSPHGWMNSGFLAGTEYRDTVLLQLAVATQADGSYSEGAIRFGFSKARKVERLRSLLQAAKVPFTEAFSEKRGTTSFRIKKTDVGPIVDLLDGKDFPWWWLNLTRECRDVVLDEVQFWDGHKASTWRMTRYSNTSNQSVDVLQALAAITNRKTRKVFTPSVNEKRAGSYGLTIRDRAGSVRTAPKRTNLSWTDKVACLAMPSGAVLVRDRGVPLIIHQTINFSILYGATEQRIGGALNMSFDDAKKLIDQYFEGLFSLKAWIDQTYIDMKRDGYVTNIFGRRRHLPYLLTWVPPTQKKPSGSPRCWGQKKEAPPLFKVREDFGKLDLPRQLPVLQDNQFMQSAASAISSAFRTKCGSCPYVSSCVLEAERRDREYKMGEELRSGLNFTIQSAATADIANRAFARILAVAMANGIPVALGDKDEGICPINLVHDEIIYCVSGRYMEAFLRIQKDVMEGVYPECTVPLLAESEIVECWGDKHIKGHKKPTPESIRAMLAAQGVDPYVLGPKYDFASQYAYP